MFANDLLKLIVETLLGFFSKFLFDTILGALGVGGE